MNIQVLKTNQFANIETIHLASKPAMNKKTFPTPQYLQCPCMRQRSRQIQRPCKNKTELRFGRAAY